MGNRSISFGKFPVRLNTVSGVEARQVDYEITIGLVFGVRGRGPIEHICGASAATRNGQ